MASLFPKRIDPACQSSAERRLFDRLRHEYGTEDWEILHSLAFPPDPSGRPGPLRLEADFVIISPAGVVFLEVKGGRVHREDSGNWIFTDRFGKQHARSKSPFQQAADSRYHFEDRIRTAVRSLVTGDVRNLPIGYAVLFPDVVVEKNANLGGESRDLLGDKEELAATAGMAGLVDRWIRHAAARQASGVRLAPQAIKAVRETLWGDFDFNPGLETMLAETREAVRGFTREQVRILEALDQEPRLYVTGGAGTGKTILAIQAAVRLAQQGRRVALMCYNRNLSGVLRARIEQVRSGIPGLEIEVIRSEQFLNKAMLAAGIKSDWHAVAATDVNRRADMILEATSQSSPAQWDALVIDEGQDVFEAGMDLLLDAALKGGLEQGEWRVFLDRDSQAGVYGRDHVGAVDSLKRCGRVLPLKENCRNAAEVIKGARAVTGSLLNEGRIKGGTCRFKESSGRPSATTASVVEGLIEQGCPTTSITVLGCRKRDCNEILEALVEAGMRATRLDDEDVARRFALDDLDAITVSTVSAFKGLENDVVVLVGVDELDDEEWGSSIKYVGVTRPRNQLHVIASKGMTKKFREAMKQSSPQPESTSGPEIDLL